ncbi:MarR family transcriptional regulator [Exiguobacterium marinum]|uniref:MarR family transcriptional regulator n=1 Tax=Exiguobacterium marinum TaxID=273528 RepID=A0ABY7X004_9BACL|nr:MarR family transcriptional regulator [Exiguobacterium marinum]WDH75256.1 MarR family transcriptional regulator [Exiguobacterium marinum]
MENLSYLLIKSSRFLKGALDKRLQEYDLTATQFSVLNQITAHNGNITSAEVAQRLESDRPTISAIINRLERDGFVEKVQNPHDKRSAYLKLNEETLKLVDELRRVSDEVNETIFEAFTEEEVSNMKAYLVKLMKHFDDM